MKCLFPELRFSQCKLTLAMTLSCCLAPFAVHAQSSAIEQVIVTARKRSEPSTQVPLSMNIIDADTIASFHVGTLAELTQFANNTTLFEDFPGAGIPTWIIRGVGLQDFNSNNTPTAGVYVDGAYQVATVMGNSTLFDVEQVEILKGPQGGLYGRNTTGGAVLLNSNRAQLEQKTRSFSLNYGRWQQAQVNAAINIPLIEDIAWRLATNLQDGSDGWQKSLVTGEDHGEKDRYDLRSWLHWQVSRAWSVQWKLQGGQDNSDIALGRSIGLYDPNKLGSYCPAILSGRRDDQNCLNFAGVNELATGQSNLVEQLTKQTNDGRIVLSSPLNKQASDYISSVLENVWELPSFDIKAITAYDNYAYSVALDLDGSNGEFGHRLSLSDIEVLSQELQLVSTEGKQFRWLLGAVVSTEEFLEHRDFNLRDNFLAKLKIGLGLARLNYKQTTNSQAIYGDFTYVLNSQWSLNATARYTNETKQYRDGDFYQLNPTPVYLFKALAADYKLANHLTGSISASYTPAANQLFYASLSRAFKSGGFYGGFPFSASDITPYLEETLIAQELGYKQNFPEVNLKLEAAVFHYNYQDVQGFVRDINPLTSTGIDQLANLADADHTGAELQVVWQPQMGWELSTGLSWLDAHFVPGEKTTTNLLEQQVRPQGQRPYAPRWEGNVEIRHVGFLSSGDRFTWMANYHAVSDRSGWQSSLVDAAVNQLPGYATLSASLMWAFVGSPWSLQLWGNNLANTVYRTRVKGDGLNSYVEFFGEPRSLGVSVTANF